MFDLEEKISHLALLHPSYHSESMRWELPARNKNGYDLMYDFSEHIKASLDGIENMIRLKEIDYKLPPFPPFTRISDLKDHLSSDSPEYKQALEIAKQRAYKLALYMAIEGVYDEETPIQEARRINEENKIRMYLINGLPFCIEGKKDDRPPYNTKLGFLDPESSVKLEVEQLEKQLEYLDSKIDKLNLKRSALFDDLEKNREYLARRDTSQKTRSAPPPPTK